MIYEKIQLHKQLPKNALYDSLIEKIIFWNDSIDIKASEYNEKYIQQFTCESSRDLKYRKSITAPRRIMQSIIEKYISICFKNEAERVQNDFYENVDLIGSDMQTFMKHMTNVSAIEGASYMMPDSIGNDESLNVAQKRVLGDRTFIRYLTNEQISDWVDIYGNLMEVLVTFEDALGNYFAMYYDSESKARIEMDKKGNVTSIGELVPHGYSQIPVVRMLPFDLEESFASNGCELQKSINNQISLQRVELFKMVYSRLFGSGIDEMKDQNGNVIPLTWGQDTLLCVSNPQADMKVLVADVNQGKTIIESFQEEIEHLYKQYHISAQSIQNGQVPSGYSLVISREDFNNVAKKFVKCAETAENIIVKLIEETENLGLEPAKYSYVFIENDYQQDLMNLRDILALNISEEVKEIAQKNFALKYFGIVPKIVPGIPQVNPQTA